MHSLLILGIIILISFGLTEGHERYISEGYFEKNEIFNDLEFDKFVKDEILCSSCQVLKDEVNSVPKLLALNRSLIGEGSHRRLFSAIGLESEFFSGHSCEAIFVEKLPSGVFADPFELQHLVTRKVFKDAAVFGDTNLELPSFRSNRSLVEVHLEVSPALSSGNNKQLEIKIELPLHARYPPLGEDFARVEFGLPSVFLRCSIEGNLHSRGCVFLLTDQSAKSEALSIVWEVPCGNKEHAGIVSVLTFISAIVSAFLIVLASVCHSNFTVSSDSKLS